MDKLKPCPFCGGNFKIIETRNQRKYYGFCLKCKIETRTFTIMNDVALFLNTRTEVSE